MSLTGELEHLPIVDVIQLIHSTRKSGTLNVFCRTGEGQLAFKDGFIVGACHSKQNLKIGQILLENGLITEDELQNAIDIQDSAGDDRKPLIATLLDYGGMSKETAYKALEKLIEMTLVEMISWTKGMFSLDVDQVRPSDDYQYLPAPLQSISMDTQMVLMDALRIYDEKVHSGEIIIVDEPLEETPEMLTIEEENAGNESDLIISDDILGLANLDQVKKKKPRIYKGLDPFDPGEIHRQVIKRALPSVNQEQQTRLIHFLTDVGSPSYVDEPVSNSAGSTQAIILHTNDEFLQHAIMTVCKKEGVLVFTTRDETEIDDLIDRSLDKLLDPVVVFGSPDDRQQLFDRDTLCKIRKAKMEKYPHVSVLQLASRDDEAFSLESLNAGVRAVLPKPKLDDSSERFAEEIIEFLNTFQTYVRGCGNEERRKLFAKLRNSLSGLRLLTKAPDISLSLLQFVGEIFERSLTLVVDRQELVCERSIGIFSDHSQGPCAAMRTRLPIKNGSLFDTILAQRSTYFGPAKDALLSETLYPHIGAPRDSQILLLPLKSRGRVVTLTYADFGNSQSRHVPLDFIDFFVRQAGVCMERALALRQQNRPANIPAQD